MMLGMCVDKIREPYMFLETCRKLCTQFWWTPTFGELLWVGRFVVFAEAVAACLVILSPTVLHQRLLALLLALLLGVVIWQGITEGFSAECGCSSAWAVPLWMAGIRNALMCGALWACSAMRRRQEGHWYGKGRGAGRVT